MSRSTIVRISVLVVLVVTLCGSSYTRKTRALAPEKCGTSCSIDAMGYCKITCPAGMRANCVPGRVLWQGNKQIVEPAQCGCVRRGPPAKKDEEQCGGSVEMIYAGFKCSQTCAPGVAAGCDLWNHKCYCAR